MSKHRIIDAHVHLWDPGLIRYPWLADNALLNKAYLLEQYGVAIEASDISGMVFVQCEADPAAFEQEADWVTRLALSDQRLKALVAWAPLEKGRAVAEDLERLARHDILRGIRRIIQFEPDVDFCLRPDFIEGVRTLADFDLSFDICIDHRHMQNVLTFLEKAPDVPMVLDHIGKPAIREGRMQPWAEQLRAAAEFPHVMCKISGVATEADHREWTAEELRPYIETALDAFGPQRVMFGGDWPVSTQAISYTRWIEVLDGIVGGMPERDQVDFWHGNAARFYRIGGCS